jgi:hypothetical protein
VQAHPRPWLALPPALVIGAALAGATLAGLAMVRGVQLGIAVAVGLCYAPLVFLNLRMAIVVWLPSVSLIAVSALDVGPNLAGLLIVMAWFGMLATRGSSVAALLVQHGRLLVVAGALVLWVLLSMAWAKQPPALGSQIIFSWLAVGLILLVISTTITERRYLRLAVGAFVLGAVISVVIGLFGGVVQDETARVVGGSGDPNFLAAGVVPGIVLAAGLAAGSDRVLVRLAVLPAIALLTVGLVASESRGGFVAAIVAAVAVLVLAKNHRAWAVAFVLCVVGVAGAWFSIDPAAWQRVSDFSESTGRSELWSVAWQMWQDHPVGGVGLDGFIDNAAGYVRDLGPLEFAEFITDEPKVVHNTYLQLLAETGIVGLALFLGVVVGCVRRAWRAAALFERMGDLPMATLARSAIAGVVAMLASGFFVSGGTDRRFWVLLALGPALLACARQRLPRREPTAQVPAQRVRASRLGPRPVAPSASVRSGMAGGAAGGPPG